MYWNFGFSERGSLYVDIWPQTRVQNIYVKNSYDSFIEGKSGKTLRGFLYV
jgi:hypothetical protein